MDSGRNELLSIMTWNIYLGANLTPIFTSDAKQIPESVSQVFRQFLATNFHERAEAIAKKIVSQNPDIIGLQEAVLLELISPNSQKAVYDFADILIKELASRGLRYKIAAQNWNVSVKMPDSAGNSISFSDRDVILAREDINIIQKQEGNFKTNLTMYQGGHPFSLIRGWSAVWASCRGYVFKLVNTHLEAFSAKVQAAQVNELIAGPGNTKLPLIFTGDFNADAKSSKNPTYKSLIDAGFEDAWIPSRDGDGFTCCQRADLLNTKSSLRKRIDFILIKNRSNWDMVKAELVGHDVSDKTPSGLWPSDHAGVVARFKLL